MSRRWSPTPAERRRVEAWVLHTTSSVEDMARALKAPIAAVAAIVEDVKRHGAP